MNRVTGSIQNKNSNGIYHMMVRIKAPDGTVMTRSKTTGIKVGRTKREDDIARRDANNMLSSWIRELERECDAKSDQRLMQALVDWLRSKKSGHNAVRQNTYQSYESFSNNHIIPYFSESNPLLRDMRYRDIKKFVDHLALTLETPTIKKVLVILRGVLDDAVRDEILDYNPCDKLRFAKAKKYEAEALTQEQAVKLISAIEQDLQKRESCWHSGLDSADRRSQGCDGRM